MERNIQPMNTPMTAQKNAGGIGEETAKYSV
jgi:hypothetical protein